MNSLVKVRIIGKNPKLYFKRYILNKIRYYNYKNVGIKEIELVIDYNSYSSLVKKKTLYDVKIVKYYGAIKYKILLKENMTLLLSFVIACLYLLLLSNTVLDIDVIHSDKSLRAFVTEKLSNKKIHKYKFIPSFDIRKKVCKLIKEENKDKIEWIEIERYGSKLIVKVLERKKNPTEETNEKRHIVAKKEGIIKKIESTSGVILKKKNDYVQKGDIIISGDIIKDDVVKAQVRAVGKVYAEVWYNVSVSYPLNYKQIIYLDDVKNNISINIFNKKFYFKKNYESINIKNKKLIKSKIFSFSVMKEKTRKVKIRTQKYTKTQAIKKATSLAEKKIIKQLKEDEYIISKKTLNFDIKDSRIEIDVFFKVYEDITSYKNVDESLLLKEPKDEE